MTRTTQGRLERLEQRRQTTRFALLSDDELRQRLDELLVELVRVPGFDETRARIARDFPGDTLDRLDALQAQGRIRAE